MARRLPVYLVLDTSGSMMGEPIAAVETGVQTLVSALRQDPYALETAYLSIITFDSNAKQIVPLTELTAFQMPSISANGLTSLGDALKLLANKIDSEVAKTTAEVKGDWKPLVFIMTDGGPTDDWKKGLAEFQKRKTGMVVACAAGQGADTNVLKQITECVVQLDTADSSTIKAFFKWVSASVSTGSQKVDSGNEVVGIGELPPPPPEVNIVV
ncbi:tellurium resistance protein TerY [Bacteroidia bacterium]|nr:tellurium resistance protein TerY [Bacteroidia bacterium]